ncbi:MAG: HK97-gp10 family putative phage morphogenesis protein [Gammaproteobacteria bacterium]
MSKVQGIKELSAALDELKDFTKADGKSVLGAAVRNPMRGVQKTAKSNLSHISPGKTPLHRTYKGRLVSAGFASRSLRTIVKFNTNLTSATAILGVKAEAFYVLAFFERGTSKIPRQPFLVPALESHKATAVDEVGDAFKNRILKIAKKYAKAFPVKS